MNTTEPLADLAWLKANGGLRMDALLEAPRIYPPARQAFHRARYAFAGERVSGMRVADVACGLGYGSHMMRDAGAAFVLGVDIDGQAIDYANRKYGDADESGVMFRACSADRIDVEDQSFSAVASFETLEHVPDDAAALMEFARILEPGGLLVCSVPNNWGLSRYHVRNYTLDSLTAALAPFFGDLDFYNQNSGCDLPRNFGQAVGIIPTSEANQGLAECYIATGKRK